MAAKICRKGSKCSTMPKNKLNALGCYIFQGSFTLGVAPYFNVLATLEDGDFGEVTTKLNWDHPIHNVKE